MASKTFVAAHPNNMQYCESLLVGIWSIDVFTFHRICVAIAPRLFCLARVLWKNTPVDKTLLCFFDNITPKHLFLGAESANALKLPHIFASSKWKSYYCWIFRSNWATRYDNWGRIFVCLFVLYWQRFVVCYLSIKTKSSSAFVIIVFDGQRHYWLETARWDNSN